MLINLIKGIELFRRKKYIKNKSFFRSLTHGQNPHTVFICCSDSRVEPIILTHSNLGELFVIKVAGNFVPLNTSPHASEVIASLEYALKSFDIKNLIVLGHSDCGAMKATLCDGIQETMPYVHACLEHDAPNHDILQKIKKQVDEEALPESVTYECIAKENILKQLDHLKTYPFISKHINENGIALYGWYYDIASTNIQILDPKKGNPEIKNFENYNWVLRELLLEKTQSIIHQEAAKYLNKLKTKNTDKYFIKLNKIVACNKNEKIRPIWKNIEKKVMRTLTDLYQHPKYPFFQDILKEAKQNFYLEDSKPILGVKRNSPQFFGKSFSENPLILRTESEIQRYNQPSP